MTGLRLALEQWLARFLRHLLICPAPHCGERGRSSAKSIFGWELPMGKLTTHQLALLSTASMRDDGAAPAPAGMAKAPARKIGASLIARELLKEIRSEVGMPIWRKNAEGVAFSLVLTAAGYRAVAAAGQDMRVCMASISADLGAYIANSKQTKRVTNLDKGHEGPRPGSKHASILSMLSDDKGISIKDLVAATGWLPHSLRATLTTFRKMGFEIERTRAPGKNSLYRIVR